MAELTREIKDLNNIHFSWRDYALMLLNSTTDPLRSIWHEKVCTSYAHWTTGMGSISEGNLTGLEILSEIPNDLTIKITDDKYDAEGDFSWYKCGRLSGSKRMNVHIGNYPQESLSAEACNCIKYFITNWDECGYLFKEVPILNKMWKLAQMSNGKCVTPDEVLTYILERPVDDKKHGIFIDVCCDIFTNGLPSQKYKKYWKSEEIENFPLNGTISDTTLSFKDIVYDPSDEKFNNETKNSNLDKLFNSYEPNIPLEEQKKNMISLCDIFLKEDVSYSPCWKKICICVLKNDVSFKYAGFGATLRERLAREDAMAAFSSKKEEKEKAKEKAKRLAEEIEKEHDKGGN